MTVMARRTQVLITPAHPWLPMFALRRRVRDSYAGDDEVLETVMPSLPREIIQRVANQMTAMEWASSGGLVNREWSKICHSHIEIEIPWQMLPVPAILQEISDEGRDPQNNGFTWLMKHVQEAEQLDAVIFLFKDFDAEQFATFTELCPLWECLPRLRCFDFPLLLHMAFASHAYLSPSSPVTITRQLRVGLNVCRFLGLDGRSHSPTHLGLYLLESFLKRCPMLQVCTAEARYAAQQHESSDIKRFDITQGT